MTEALGVLTTLPWWYWAVGILVLLSVISDSKDDVKDATLHLLSGLASLTLLTAIFLLWPVAVIISTVSVNRSNQQEHGRSRAFRSPEWFLDYWAGVPRSFGHHRGRWLITGRWWPPLTTHPIQYLPRHNSTVDGRTLTLNLLAVEVAVTHLSPASPEEADTLPAAPMNRKTLEEIQTEIANLHEAPWDVQKSASKPVPQETQDLLTVLRMHGQGAADVLRQLAEFIEAERAQDTAEVALRNGTGTAADLHRAMRRRLAAADQLSALDDAHVHTLANALTKALEPRP